VSQKVELPAAMAAKLSARIRNWDTELRMGQARTTLSAGIALSAFQALEEILRAALRAHGIREIVVRGDPRPVAELGIGQCVRGLDQNVSTAGLLSTTERRELMELSRTRNRWFHESRPTSAAEVRAALSRIAAVCASPGFGRLVSKGPIEA